MSGDIGFSRRSSSERDIQPVAIISVDPTTRTAIAVTRNRTNLTINCAYATGDTITVPAAGEQWYCERFDGEWRLYNRIPFNDPTLHIKPEEGQVSVGSARGPLELNGTEVRLNGKVTRINGVYYRDNGNALQRSTDQVSWTAISSTDMINLLPVIAEALTTYEGTDPDLALVALRSWGNYINLLMENFSSFWNEICQNVFVNGLKGMGFGDTDLSKIISGAQNFIDYLFGILFCKFDENITPLKLLIQIRDLFWFLGNPSTPVGAFLAGLREFFILVGGVSDTLLKDAISGVVEFFNILFGIFLCDENAFTKARMVIDATVSNLGLPGSVIKIIAQMFAPFNSQTNPIGIFLRGLKDFAESTGHTVYTLFDGAVTGAVEFAQIVIGVLTCDPGKLSQLVGLVGATLPGMATPLAILSKLSGILGPLATNKWITLFSGFGSGDNLISKLLTGVTEILDWFLDVLKLIFPFIPWDTFMAGTLPSFTGYNPASLIPQIDVSKIKDLVKVLTGRGQEIVGEISEEMQKLKDFFDGFTTTDGGLLNQIVKAMTGTAFASGPLKILSDLFTGVSATGGTLVSQLTASLNVLGGSLDIGAIVSAITRIDIVELTNSYTLTVTGSPTGGTFTLSYDGATTGPITYSTTAATTRANIQSALVLLTPIGAGNATVTIAPGSGKFTASINNTDGTLTLGASSLTGGTSPAITVVQKFRGPLTALNSFFSDFNVFDGANTLISQVLNLNISALVSKITGMTEAAITAAGGALSVLQNFFSGFDVFGGAATGGNTLVNQIVKKILGGDGTLKTLTDLGTFFSGLRTLFGYTGTGGFAGFNAATAVTNLITQINGSAIKIAATAISDLGVNQITNLVKFITGSDTNTATTLQNFFAGLGGTGTLSSTSLLGQIAYRITGSTSGLDLTAINTVFANIRKILGITDPLSLITPITNLATYANNFFANFLSFGTFFTNLKTVFGPAIDFTAPVATFNASVATAASGLIGFLNLATGGVLLNTNKINVSGIGATINPDAGSGGRMVRTSTGLVAAGANGSRRVSSSFFNLLADVPGPTSGITASTASGSFTVTTPGWYMVEVAYKVYANASWGWNMAPMLFLNDSPYKVGTDVMYTWTGLASAGAQRYVQNNFIVHLNAGDAVQAGYNVHINPVALNRNILGASTNSGTETYFTIALLNKTFA